MPVHSDTFNKKIQTFLENSTCKTNFAWRSSKGTLHYDFVHIYDNEDCVFLQTLTSQLTAEDGLQIIDLPLSDDMIAFMQIYNHYGIVLLQKHETGQQLYTKYKTADYLHIDGIYPIIHNALKCKIDVTLCFDILTEMHDTCRSGHDLYRLALDYLQKYTVQCVTYAHTAQIKIQSLPLQTLVIEHLQMHLVSIGWAKFSESCNSNMNIIQHMIYLTEHTKNTESVLQKALIETDSTIALNIENIKSLRSLNSPSVISDTFLINLLSKCTIISESVRENDIYGSKTLLLKHSHIYNGSYSLILLNHKEALMTQITPTVASTICTLTSLNTAVYFSTVLVERHGGITIPGLYMPMDDQHKNVNLSIQWSSTSISCACSAQVHCEISIINMKTKHKKSLQLTGESNEYQHLVTYATLKNGYLFDRSCFPSIIFGNHILLKITFSTIPSSNSFST